MALTERTFWIDGRTVPATDVTVHLLSQSLQRGSLVFDVFGVEQLPSGPHGLGAREHTERFLRSLELMGMPAPYGFDELFAVARDMAHLNPGCDTVRFNAYWDVPSIDVLPNQSQPAIAVAAYSIDDLHPGLGPGTPPPGRITIPGVRKLPPEVIPVQAKVAAAYAHTGPAKARARAAGFHDLVLVDADGCLTESGNMSFFVVVDGLVRTAGLDQVLDGITRRVVLDIAAHEGIHVSVGPLAPAVLDDADEVFMASTSRHVWAIGQVDSRSFEAPGPITARLQERFLRLLSGKDELSARWLQPL
ncbi:MAG TPA: aminotransferase class IV [Acidimicrobiales bacterium]